ncbi:MAG: response regulator [Candidatus Accumulibacter necessarius]|jgi:two-component system response regulator FlrC|uniref:response regulator n=1 Tax=Candidatus Accumulibacter necessarius TaxID=2954386 RepID=UPI002FC30CD4
MVQGLPILVVEDDAALREAVCDTLELAGPAVVSAGGGDEALQLLARHGRVAGGQRRAHAADRWHCPAQGNPQSLPYLPVVLMTAFADVDRAVEAMRAGACDFLLKPFEPKALLEHVQRYRLPEAHAMTIG